jgi:hypothetical protein
MHKTIFYYWKNYLPGVDYPDATLVINVCYGIIHLPISSCWMAIGIMLNC